MTVLVVARWYPSYDNPGRGIFVADQVSALRSAGVDVHVAAFEQVIVARQAGSHDVDLRRLRLWAERAAADQAAVPIRWGSPGVPVGRLPAAVPEGTSTVEADPLLLAELEAETLVSYGLALHARAPIDLIHAHTGLPDGLAAARLADRLGVPLVVTEHDSTLRERLLDRSLAAAYRSLVRTGWGLVAVSARLARQLERQLDLEEGAVAVVPNAVPLDLFTIVGGDARSPDELVWVGGRRPNKGIETLLRAFRLVRPRHPKLQLRLIGRAPSDQAESELRELAAALGVAEAVTFEPPADRPGVAAAMARATLFVHPSPYETFGVVAVEALASGLPIVATPSGVEEILGRDGRFGVVAGGHEPEQLATAIDAALERRAQFDPWAMRAHVEDRYAAPAVARRLVDLYARLAPGRPSLAAGVAAIESVASQPDAARPAVIVGHRRRRLAGRLARFPADLATELVVVTRLPTRGGEDPIDLPDVREIDADLEYRDRLALLGGPLPSASVVRRGARVALHPRRALARQRLRSERPALARQAWREAVAKTIRGARSDGTEVLIVPADVDDLEAIEPLLGPGVRLAPGSIGWLADVRDSTGRDEAAHVAVVPGDEGDEPDIEDAGSAEATRLPETYVPADYWHRLHDRADLSAVGQSGLSPEINRWLYRAMEGSVRRFARRHRLFAPPPAAVFDVGVGTGYWVRVWRDLGALRVDGCDLVPAAVDRVGKESAATGAMGDFIVADISDPGALPERRYGLVSCLNVLLHVTDDRAFEAALANIAALVGPGGHLLLAESIVQDPAYETPAGPGRASRARHVDRYRAPLERAGLRLVELRPAVALANNPVEARSDRAFDRYRAWWRFVARRSRGGYGHRLWLGPLVLIADRVALALGLGPSTKLALFARPDAADANRSM